MARYDYDFCVLGGGSGGVRAARIASKLGARVVLVEESDLGGTCVHAGCIPKKLFMYASRYARGFEDARGYGWAEVHADLDWRGLLAAKDAELGRLAGIYGGVLDGAGVEVVKARGTILDAHSLRVGDRTLTTEHLLIATGGRPFVPDVPGSEHAITSDDAFHISGVPRCMVVVGGGYVALEFASIFRSLGSEVSLVHRGKRLLRDFDGDVQQSVAEALGGAGVDLRFETEVSAIEKPGDRLLVRLSDGSEQPCDVVLYATGRKPSTGGFGLERTGVELRDDGAIIVDAYGRTSVPGVHAVGDVIGGAGLTPVALAEGEALANTLFGKDGPVAADRELIPTCVFSQPSVGVVGLTEEQARARHANVQIYRSRYRPLEHTLSGRRERMMVKLVVDADTDRVLGVHVVAAEAGEIVQGFAVALRCGATKKQFDDTIGIHPTAAEELLTLREPVG